MKGILLLNGDPYEGEISAKDAFVVCCDGAYAWAKDKLPIDENVGDFDSLPYLPVPLPQRIYPSEKNLTDGELGLQRLLALGCNPIEIYGGEGGREDHFIGNLHLLYYANQSKVLVKMFTKNAQIYPAEGEVEIADALGKTISLFPFGKDAHIIDSEGLKYSLRNLTLTYGNCRGISNVVTSPKARFHCQKGTVLVFLNKK